MSLDKCNSFSQKDLFGGLGEVQIWNLISGRKMPPFSAALWCELEPNGSIGRHRQQRDPEVVLCLSGQGRATIGKHPHSMEKGSFLYVPFGATLAIDNLAEEVLRYVIIKVRQ